MFVQMFAATLFLTAPNWKHPKQSPTGVGINRLRYIHSVGLSSKTKHIVPTQSFTHHRHTRLVKETRRERVTLCGCCFACSSRTDKSMIITEGRAVVTSAGAGGGRRRGGWEGAQRNLWEAGDALDLDASGGYLCMKEHQGGCLRLIQFIYSVT